MAAFLSFVLWALSQWSGVESAAQAALAARAAPETASAAVRVPPPPPTPRAEPAPDRRAVVIAVEDYPPALGPAPGASDDADHVAAALDSAGYAVETLTNPDAPAIRAAVRRAANDGARLTVVYFVGHGVQLGGRAVLLGAEAGPGDAIALAGQGVSLDRVRDLLARAAGEVVVIVDAAPPRSLLDSQNVKPGLRAPTPPARGAFFLAGEPDAVRNPRQPGVSAFARGVAGLMRPSDDDIDDALRKAADAMTAQTDGALSPWVSENLPDGVYFVGPIPELRADVGD